ncbi:MAG: 30S ribosomal protein S16 [Deltaproteobacteria bacterium]|nr:MAG: 30S ribosomal protein S16 [Deltaproteobacteria bacterium]
MAVSIRLARFGAKKKPFYRIVAADSRFPKEGRSIERLGIYDPRQEPALVRLNMERIDYWFSQGAKASKTVLELIEKQKKGLGQKTTETE